MDLIVQIGVFGLQVLPNHTFIYNFQNFFSYLEWILCQTAEEQKEKKFYFDCHCQL